MGQRRMMDEMGQYIRITFFRFKRKFIYCIGNNTQNLLHSHPLIIHEGTIGNTFNIKDSIKFTLSYILDIYLPYLGMYEKRKHFENYLFIYHFINHYIVSMLSVWKITKEATICNLSYLHIK